MYSLYPLSLCVNNASIDQLLYTSLLMQLIQKGINVTVVCPGPIASKAVAYGNNDAEVSTSPFSSTPKSRNFDLVLSFDQVLYHK